MAPTTHVVAFKFAPEASEDAKETIKSAITGLTSTATLDGEPYIVSIRSGDQNSPEGMHHDTDWVFVVEFKSAEDRDYYVDECPAHKAAKDAIGKTGALAGVVVLDFSY